VSPPASRAPWLRPALLLILWGLLILGALALGPSGDDQDGARVWAFFQLQGEPIAVAIFNALGVWPLVFGAVLLRDPPQRVPMWPFYLLSFGIGGFVLLPGLALRRWGAAARDAPGLLRRALTGRALGAVLLLVSIGLLVLACTGSPAAFLELAARSSLVHAMSLDFLALHLAWFLVLHDDARRHPGPSWRVWLGGVPLLGPPVWILVR